MILSQLINIFLKLFSVIYFPGLKNYQIPGFCKIKKCSWIYGESKIYDNFNNPKQINNFT